MNDERWQGTANPAGRTIKTGLPSVQDQPCLQSLTLSQINKKGKGNRLLSFLNSCQMFSKAAVSVYIFTVIAIKIMLKIFLLYVYVCVPGCMECVPHVCTTWTRVGQRGALDLLQLWLHMDDCEVPHGRGTKPGSFPRVSSILLTSEPSLYPPLPDFYF